MDKKKSEEATVGVPALNVAKKIEVKIPIKKLDIAKKETAEIKIEEKSAEDD